jgi:RNA polymerase sigma factor (TIGR02999 family)
MSVILKLIPAQGDAESRRRADISNLSKEHVTRLCHDAAHDDPAAVDQLVDHVYTVLRRMASRHMGSERPDHTLTPTALVHEAYIRLVDQNSMGWQDRAHFYAIAARVMRRVLIDHARRRLADKRGGGQQMVTLHEDAAAVTTPENLLELDRALDKLDQLSPRQRQVVEMRFFGGMTHEETAEVVGVSVPTVRRDWRVAQAWLKREMAG